MTDAPDTQIDREAVERLAKMLERLEGYWSLMEEEGTSYTLTTHARALVAEAHGDAARAAIAAGVRTYEANKERHPSHAAEAFDLCEEVAEAIRALTPADAIAALEADRKQVREQALREAAALIDRKIKAVQPEMSRRAQRLAEGKKPGFQYAIHRSDLDARMSDRDAILALIEKDKTDDG